MTDVLSLYSHSLAKPADNFIGNCALLFYKIKKTFTTSWVKSVFCVQEDELKKAILLVFANKQDIEGAMTVTEVANALGLPAMKNRKYQIFKTSAIKGEGLDEAMEW